MSEPDPYAIVSDLIGNAVNTAKVSGENRRISNLVAGSVARFMADMENGGALLSHALACVGDEDAEHVPTLMASLQGLRVARA